MAIADQKINQFLDDLASKKPTPGGGSASAMSGAMGASLTSKVAKLTKDKPEFVQIDKTAEKLMEELLRLIDEDCQAFKEVVKAYRLPKKSETQNGIRKTKIQEALKYAAEVPLETAKKSLEVLKLASFTAAKGNKNCVSDARCAIELAIAAIYGALENVRINLKSIKDKKFGEYLRDEIDKILAEESLKVG